jgi:mRNA interferase HigB
MQTQIMRYGSSTGHCVPPLGSKMQDVVTAYPSARVLNAERVIFPITGNNYRAVVAFDFLRHAAFIEFVGTHAEYDKINALTIDLYSRRGPT